jgi:hypothetical protein
MIPPEWQPAWRAAGDAYDAEVHRIWAGIGQDLTTRVAWELARTALNKALLAGPFLFAVRPGGGGDGFGLVRGFVIGSVW